MNADQTGQLVLMASRYAMGRRSSAPADCADLVRTAWPDMASRWRVMLQQNLADELRRCEALGETLGMDCDHETWSSLLEWMRGRP